MKIDDFKPLAAFVENTVKPILEELNKLGFEIGLEDIKDVVGKLAFVHILSTIITCLRDVLVIGAIAYIVCMI